MSGPRMTKDEMATGLARGRSLIQEEWADPTEVRWVDELVAEGRASVTEWTYRDSFQCSMRRVFRPGRSARLVMNRPLTPIDLWPATITHPDEDTCIRCESAEPMECSLYCAACAADARDQDRAAMRGE